MISRSNPNWMVNEIKLDNFFADRDVMKGFELRQGPQLVVRDHLSSESDGNSPNSSNVTSSSSTSHGGGSSEEADLDLLYINRILNEGDIDEKLDMFLGHPAFEATEKNFYEILGEKYMPPADQPQFYNHHGVEPPLDCSSIYVYSGDSSARGSVVNSAAQNYPVSVGYSLQSSFISSANNIHNDSQGLVEPTFEVGDLDQFAENLLAWQFTRGVEEASKFWPSAEKLVGGSEARGISLAQESREDNGFFEVKEEKEDTAHAVYGARGQKNRHSDDSDLEEGRSNKQSAVDYSEETLRSELFDLVLLCPESKGGEGASISGGMQNEATRSTQNGHSRGSGGGKGRRKKQPKSEVVDLRTLLIHCAQAVATDDRRSANELLRQIRQHASPFGDGTQRVALCFADGLEARLAGTGSDKYHSLVAKPVTATEILKAYKLYMSASPFKKISHFFSNQMILNTTEKASRVHILDFGIYYGFQWPAFIQRISARRGGPPKLRITGIDLPQPGFRPAEMIEETGRRLAEYARMFDVPFEYHAIAAKWETIRIEDLRIDEHEVLVVNSLFRLKNLADETVVADCPRNKVLNMIRKLKPAIFVHGVVNGSYSAPFFVTRFREALFHFSASFDMLETNTAREDAERMLIERAILGRDALNVIACEGSERVERPETYKQWQVRNFRAGLVQLPLDQNIIKKARDKVKASYHKDFVIDEDSRWLLQGWKGRIICALSAWKSNMGH